MMFLNSDVTNMTVTFDFDVDFDLSIWTVDIFRLLTVNVM